MAIASATSAVKIPGDWNVTGHTPMADDIMYVEGNITVKSGGWLDLTDIDIVWNCTQDGQYTLEVETGGRLTFNRGSMSAEDASKRYKVELWGQATLEGIDVTDTWGEGVAFDSTGGGDPPLTGLRGGVMIYSDSVYIGNSTLSHGLLCMVYASDCSPTLYGNTIHNVTYDVRAFSQSTTNPSSTSWSAVAFGVLLDNSNAKLRNNDFFDVGTFVSMAGVYYSGASVNNNNYYVTAAAVASRASRIDVENCVVANTGVLEKAQDTFSEGGNTVNQRFYQYRVAGVYGYLSRGSNIKLNEVTTSTHGLYIVVTRANTGGPITFDVIIDNKLNNNAKAGAFFDLASVALDCTINVTDNDLNRNGEGTVSDWEDSGLIVRASACTGDLTVIIGKNNFLDNHGRGAYVDARDHAQDLRVHAITSTNTFSGNGGAGLLVNMDTVNTAVNTVTEVHVENSTFTNNRPNVQADPGALSITGGSIRGALDIKVAHVTSSSNNGNGLGIELGAVLSVNLATSTKYTILNSQFNANTERGIYILDSYGANAQKAKYDIRGVTASDNQAAMYIHSNSALGNINFQLAGFTAMDSGLTSPAVTIQLSAPAFTPKAKLRNMEIRWTAGSAPGATGLVLQGVEATKRWVLELLDSHIAQPGTGLDAQFCDVTATGCNITGQGFNSVVARDSTVHLYDCEVPSLSAQTSGGSMNVGVFFYEWFNITQVSWQNGQPIKNQTVTIRRYRNPPNVVYDAKTDAQGKLPFAQVPFWVRDEDNTPLVNNELQAFLNIRGDILNSLWFDFNRTHITIDDPQVPELVINTPAPNTVTKSSTINVQGEIRDTHSGIRYVEVTVDNVVWIPAKGIEEKAGFQRAVFEVPLTNLTDGTYTITIRGWDVARYPQQNLTYALETIKDVKVDTLPPYLEILKPASPHHVTNKKWYRLVGQTESSPFIRKLTINDLLIPFTGKTFEYNASLNDGDGTYTFVVIAEDLAGNIAVQTRQIVVDTVAPSIYVSSPQYDGFASNDQDFEVAGDTEQTANVFVRLDDDAPKPVLDRGGTRFYYVQKITKEGGHRITVIVVDAAGNEATFTRAVKYDITPPVLEDIIPAQDSKPSNNQLVYVAGRTDPDVSDVVVNGLIFKVTSGDFALEISLLEGDQNLIIEVTDAAGNYNFTTRNIFIDVTPPLVRGLKLSSTKPGGREWLVEEDLIINERSVRFRGSMSEGDFKEVWISVEGDNRSAIFDVPETYSFYRDFNMKEGTNLVIVYASDIAGNRVVWRYNVTVDTIAPIIEYLNPKMGEAREATVRDDTVVISGVFREERNVVLMIYGRQVTVRPDSGAFQTTVPLDEGLNNIDVVVTDRAGNLASDVLRITYKPEGEEKKTLGQYLKDLWWVFAILVGLLILVPITVQTTRDRWVKEHPELMEYDRRTEHEGLYEYEDEGYQDEGYQKGGGY